MKIQARLWPPVNSQKKKKKKPETHNFFSPSEVHAQVFVYPAGPGSRTQHLCAEAKCQLGARHPGPDETLSKPAVLGVGGLDMFLFSSHKAIPLAREPPSIQSLLV